MEGDEKMTKVKKLLSVVLSVIMICSCSVCANTAFAAESPDEGQIMPLYEDIQSYSAAITISGVTANCSVSVNAQSSSYIKIVMELQKKSGSSYSTVETWTGSKTGTYYTMSKSKTINRLNTYRLKATITVGSETIIVYRY